MEATGMKKWLPLVAVCLGTFMLLIDVTIVNVALPDMANDLKTSFSSLQWVIDAYALALAALVLGAGSIADRIGHRRAYLGGLVLFAVASAVCGISPNAGALITARTVQGVGAAFMFATTFALLNSNYSGRDRGTAYGLWGAVSGAAAAVGPILGGFLTEGVSWRWIFFVNVPISVVAIAMCVLVLKDATATVRSRIDIAGMVLFTASAASLTYGLIRADEHSWGAVGSWGWLAASPVLLAVFVLVERRGPGSTSGAPMLDLSLFRAPGFVAATVGALATGTGIIATTSFLSTAVERGLGRSGLVGAVLLLAWSGTSVVTALLARRLPEHWPGRWRLAGGLVVVAVGQTMLLGLDPSSSPWVLAPGLAVAGAASGLINASLGREAVANVPPDRAAMGGGANNTARYVGSAIGVTVVAVVATRPGLGAGPAAAVAGWNSAVVVATVFSVVGALAVAACRPWRRATGTAVGGQDREHGQDDARPDAGTAQGAVQG